MRQTISALQRPLASARRRVHARLAALRRRPNLGQAQCYVASTALIHPMPAQNQRILRHTCPVIQKIVDNSLIAIDKTGFLGTTDGSQFRLGIPVGNDVRAVLLRLSLGLGLLSFGAVAQANADTTFQFLYTATDGSGITASGTLTTGAADGSGFDITSVYGIWTSTWSSPVPRLRADPSCNLCCLIPCAICSAARRRPPFLTTPISPGGLRVDVAE